MTREEQLACLKDRPCNVCKMRTDKGCNSWECVFEQTPDEEKEPCDCISRAEAIKALEYDLSIEADGGLDKYRTVIKDLLNAIYNTQKKAIEDLPSIQPKTELETWEGIHAQVTAPKGTFDKIWNEAEDNDEI